jgi:hypothetical protein
MLTTARNTVRSHRGLGACHMGTAPGDGGLDLLVLAKEQEGFRAGCAVKLRPSTSRRRTSDLRKHYLQFLARFSCLDNLQARASDVDDEEKREEKGTSALIFDSLLEPSL